MLRTVWRIFVGLLAVIGAVVGIVAVSVMIAFFGFEGPEPLPEKMILRVNIDGRLQDTRVAESLPFQKEGLVLREVLMGLRQAANDERVAGVAVHMGGYGGGLPTAQELRAVVRDLRAAGKSAMLFTEDLGGLGGGTAAYYLASAFDEIWVQPSGGVGLIGIALEMPYARGLLDKLEVEPQFGQRYEYKSAVESITAYGMSDPVRRNYRTLLDSLYAQLVSGIAESRGFDEAEVRRLVDGGPYLAQEALEKRLIDRIGYWDEFTNASLASTRGAADSVSLERYLASIERPNSSGPKVALIYGSGAITSGSADDGNGFGGTGFKAHTVADAISDAVEDDDIEAILFRIDSPGGSYVASDIVWRELQRAKDAGKPVIVSMGGTAASGGYFVAVPADRIVAQPATITGSIGVYGGKVVTRDMWDKIGVAWDELHVGENANMWSLISEFPPGGEKRFREMLDFIYEDFTGKVVQERGLGPQEIEQVARGRVWTGQDALEHGLVDVLGGYEVAISEVKQSLGLAEEDGITLELHPRPRSPFEKLTEILSGNGKPLAEAGIALSRAGDSGPIGEIGDRFGISPDNLELLQPPAGVLQMPPMRLRY